jgi:hypothetical protein
MARMSESLADDCPMLRSERVHPGAPATMMAPWLTRTI